MPSVKSYQNRKHDIEVLQRRLEQYEVWLNNKDQVIRGLEARVNHYANALFDYTSQQIPHLMIVQNTGRTQIELLQKEVAELKQTLRLYRDYIMTHYHDEDFLTMVEIPKCLKPLDAVKYIGNAIEYTGDKLGPDYNT